MGNDQAPRRRREERAPWSPPRVRRLATSAAQFGASAHIDAEGFS
jgi:hypothetical protein